jgi:hypothetical protein
MHKEKLIIHAMPKGDHGLNAMKFENSILQVEFPSVLEKFNGEPHDQWEFRSHVFVAHTQDGQESAFSALHTDSPPFSHRAVLWIARDAYDFDLIVARGVSHEVSDKGLYAPNLDAHRVHGMNDERLDRSHRPHFQKAA